MVISSKTVYKGVKGCKTNILVSSVESSSLTFSDSTLKVTQNNFYHILLVINNSQDCPNSRRGDINPTSRWEKSQGYSERTYEMGDTVTTIFRKHNLAQRAWWINCLLLLRLPTFQSTLDRPPEARKQQVVPYIFSHPKLL